MSVPCVSVILPVYNASKYLEQCLNSIFSQSFSDFELLAIDDGSTDDSLSILQSYAQKDLRILIISQENKGAAASRNKGIQMAQGEYLAFMDSDDLYPEPDTLKKLYENAKRNNALVCGGSFSEFRAGSKRIISQWDDSSVRGYVFDSPGIIQYEDYQFDCGFSRFIYQRAFIIENGLAYPEYQYFEDPPFFVKTMAAAGQFYAIPDITYRYRLGLKLPALSTTPKVLDALAGIEHNIHFAHANAYHKLRAFSVKRLCELLDLIDNYDLSIMARLFELLKLLESFPEAASEVSLYAEALQEHLMGKKSRYRRRMERLEAFVLTRLGLKIGRSIKRALLAGSTANTTPFSQE